MQTASWRPALAVADPAATGDGVAYVGRLLQHALGTWSPRGVLTVRLHRGPGDRPRFRDQLRFAARLAAEQRARSADFWIFNHVGIARAQLLVPPLIRQPFAVFLHGVEAWREPLGCTRMRAVSRAFTLIANSNFTARRVREAQPRIGPIAACPLGLLPESIPAVAARPGRWSDMPRGFALIVGRMSAAERYKGHDQLIECWPQVLRAAPHAQLIVAGSGDDLARLREKARQAGLADSIRFLGHVSDSDLDQLRRRAAVFVMPSQGEGFGLVYLEAMRAGLPCIGSTIDAAGEVIVHGETGALVDPFDRAAVAREIAMLLLDSELRARWGSNGLKRFEAEFTFERFATRLDRVLLSALGLRQ